MRRPELIYIERAARQLESAGVVLRNYPDLPVVEIDSYSEIFHRKSQSFRLQKSHPALILALSSGPYLYESPARVGGDSESKNYYTDQWRNCLFDCDYCFLQGMHKSAYPVIFLNQEDYHQAAVDAARDGPVSVSTSFLTDALSFESIVPTVSGWLDIAERHPEIEIEVRTKSDVVAPFIGRPPLPNVKVIWTLSPSRVSNQYERGCANLAARLEAIALLARKGWGPGFAIDPVILFDNWQTEYGNLIRLIDDTVDAHQLSDISYGVFRMATGFLGTIRESRADSALLYHPFVRSNGLATYSPAEAEAIHTFVGAPLRQHFGPERVSFVHG